MTDVKIEQLTDDERHALTDSAVLATEGEKALRIIDAHAAVVAAQAAEYTERLEAWEVDRKQLLADRAALVAQLEAARGECAQVARERDALLKQAIAEAGHAISAEDRVTALVAQVAELTRERNEARDNHVLWRTACEDSQRKHRAEVTRLTEALAAAERAKIALADTNVDLCDARRAAEARVRELEAGQGRFATEALTECAATKVSLAAAESECAALRAEVERLQASDLVIMCKAYDNASNQRDAAESECAALRDNQEKVLQRADFFQAEHRKALDETFSVLQARDAAESRLAAANALLEEYVRGPFPSTKEKARAHLAAQPATAPHHPEHVADGTLPCLSGSCPCHVGPDGEADPDYPPHAPHFAQPATAPARTEAEQAVLDAMRDAKIRVDRDGYPYFSDTTRVVCEAELARRGQ